MSRIAWAAVVLALLAAPPAGASTERSRGLAAALERIDSRLTGSLIAAERRAVHEEKAELIASFFDGRDRVMLEDLDCVATRIQMARAGRARAHARAAGACMTHLAASVPASAALSALRRDLRAIVRRIRAGRAFGVMATGWRRKAVVYVKEHRRGEIEGLSLGQYYADLECIDVKVEAGRVSGAGSCARRLKRLVEENAPLSPLVTFGSDLTGEPVAMPGTWPEDTEFWTGGVTVPADGMITRFRMRIGSDPVDLPLRFSITRPQPDGRLLVISTTDPPYPLPGNKPGTYTFSAAELSFRCCRVRKGDVVTANNRGADQTRDPYVWFARRPGAVTFSHTCSPCGASMDPGNHWTGTPHQDLELLLQVEMRPD